MLDYLAQAAQVTGLGARALKRLVQQEITTPVSEQLILRHDNPPQSLSITCDSHSLRFSWVVAAMVFRLFQRGGKDAHILLAEIRADLKASHQHLTDKQLAEAFTPIQ